MITIYQIQNLFSHLPKPMFDIPNWFIAGGSATSSSFSDIDIYFSTQAAYDAVLPLFKEHQLILQTENAISFKLPRTNAWLEPSSSTIQLIHRSFQPIPLILADFDLNVCRKAILPSGKLFTLPESNHPLQVDLSNLRANTASRFIKYVERGFITHTLRFEELIHHLIANLDVELPGYYANTTQTCFNALFKLYSYPPFSGTISCIIDSYPPSVRSDIYARLCPPNVTTFVPDPSLSHEFQLVTSTAHPTYATSSIIISNPEIFL